MISLLIFDLDGTLLDTVQSLTNQVNRALQREGLKPLPVPVVQGLLGNGSAYLINGALDRAGGQDLGSEERARILADYNRAYLADPTVDTVPYPGMRELLVHEKEKGRQLGVFTNKPHAIAVEVLDYFFGDLVGGKVFDVIQGQVDTIPRKPNPQGLYHMIEQTGISRKETLYIGDSEVDALTGKNAGLKTLLVSYGFREAEALELFHYPIFPSVRALGDYFDQLPVPRTI